MQLFQAYLGAETTGRVGAQHVLNAEYFKRIDALNYTMMHDDGQHVEGLEEADVVLVGVSRTSKTPTSIYLANRGVAHRQRAAGAGHSVAAPAGDAEKAAGGQPACDAGAPDPGPPEPAAQHGRRYRPTTIYIDRQSVTEEVAYARKRLAPNTTGRIIDVTRRSIEETAAAVMKLLGERRRSATRLSRMKDSPCRSGCAATAGPGVEKRHARQDAARRCRPLRFGIRFRPRSTSATMDSRKPASVGAGAAARLLARAKADLRSRRRNAGHLVLGCDQTLARGHGCASASRLDRAAGRAAIAAARAAGRTSCTPRWLWCATARSFCLEMVDTRG